MKCVCRHEVEMGTESREHKSFAVIAEASYQRFLDLERNFAEAAPPEERLHAITRSARFVGALRTCPDCARLVLIHPGGGQVEYYIREKLPDV